MTFDLVSGLSDHHPLGLIKVVGSCILFLSVKYCIFVCFHAELDMVYGRSKNWLKLQCECLRKAENAAEYKLNRQTCGST